VKRVTRKRLLWHLLPWYLIAAAVCLAGLIFYSSRAFTAFYVGQRERDRAALARVAAFDIADQAQGGVDTPETHAALEVLCRNLARGAEARLTVVDPAGRVLCDSEKDSGTLENHGGRPEIREALEGRPGTSVRFSSTLEENLLYVAVPFDYRGRPGAVRFAVSVASLGKALAGLRRDLVLGALAAIGLVVLVSALLARRLAVPLRELRRGAVRFAQGDFSQPLPLPAFDEFAVVTEEMNRMAAQLDERIRGEVRQRQELEAVLSSMVEGVLAFDREANLIMGPRGGCSACAPSRSGAGASRRRCGTRSFRSSSPSRFPEPSSRSRRSRSSTRPASASSRRTAPASRMRAATASGRSSCSTT
jgi:two-component system phosphate regulon sensor histidine kinase PhoR